MLTYQSSAKREVIVAEYSLANQRQVVTHRSLVTFESIIASPHRTAFGPKFALL